MAVIYNITTEIGLATEQYFLSEEEAVQFCYSDLGAKHDYEFIIREQFIPDNYFNRAIEITDQEPLHPFFMSITFEEFFA
jgi:hypothetical protein